MEELRQTRKLVENESELMVYHRAKNMCYKLIFSRKVLQEEVTVHYFILNSIKNSVLFLDYFIGSVYSVKLYFSCSILEIPSSHPLVNYDCNI